MRSALDTSGCAATQQTSNSTPSGPSVRSIAAMPCSTCSRVLASQTTLQPGFARRAAAWDAIKVLPLPAGA